MPFPMGLAIKNDKKAKKERLTCKKGYIDDDIPLLESFGVFENGQPSSDLKLYPEDYRTFIDWLDVGPIFPVPRVAQKILCTYRRKLLDTVNDFSVTDGSRLQAQNVIVSIEHMLKEGDETIDAEMICAKGGADEPEGKVECCDELKAELQQVKDNTISLASDLAEAKAEILAKINNDTAPTDEQRAEEARRRAEEAYKEAKEAYDKLKTIEQDKTILAVDLELEIEKAERAGVKAALLLQESEALYRIANNEEIKDSASADILVDNVMGPIIVRSEPNALPMPKMVGGERSEEDSAKLESAHDIIKDLGEATSEARGRLASLKLGGDDRVNELEAEITKKQTEINELLINLNNGSGSKDSLLEVIKKLEQEIDDLTKSLSEVVAAGKTAVDEASRYYVASQNIISKFIKELKHSQRMILILVAKVHSMNHTLIDLTKYYKMALTTINQLNSIINNKDKLIGDQEKQISDLIANLKEKTAQLTAALEKQAMLEKALNDSEMERKALQKSLDEKGNFTHSHDNLAKLEKELDDANSELNHLKKELAHAKMPIHNEKLALAEKELNAKTIQSNSYKNDLAVRTSELSLSQAELARLEQINEQNLQIVESIREQIAKLSANSANKSADIALLEKKYDDKLDEYNDLLNTIKIRTAQYTKSQEELARLEKIHDQTLKELEDLKTKMAALLAEKDKSELNRKKAIANAADKDAKIANLENKVGSMKDEDSDTDANDERVKELEANIEEKTAKIKHLSEQIKADTDDFQKATVEKEAIQGQVNESDKIIVDLRNQLAGKEKQLDENQLELADFKTRLEAKNAELKAGLEAKNAELKAGLEAKNAELKAGLEAKNAELKAGLEAKNAELKVGLEAKNTELKVGLEAKNAESKAGLEAKNAELKARLEERNAELEARISATEIDDATIEDLRKKLARKESELLEKKIDLTGLESHARTTDVALEAAIARAVALDGEVVAGKAHIDSLNAEHSAIIALLDLLDAKANALKTLIESHLESDRQTGGELLEEQIDSIKTSAASKVNEIEKAKKYQAKMIMLLKMVNDLIKEKTKIHISPVNKTRKVSGGSIKIKRVKQSLKAAKPSRKNKSGKNKNSPAIFVHTDVRGRTAKAYKKGARLTKLYREIPPLY